MAQQAKIAAILADWSNEFSDQWAAKKHARTADILYLADELQARIDEIQADAQAATEVMKRVDPTAAPVRVDTRELRGLVRDKAKLLAQYAHEMGQLPDHAAAIAGRGYSISTRRALLGLSGPGKKEPVPSVEPEPEPEDEDMDFGYRRPSLPSTEAILARANALVGGNGVGSEQWTFERWFIRNEQLLADGLELEDEWIEQDFEDLRLDAARLFPVTMAGGPALKGSLRRLP